MFKVGDKVICTASINEHLGGPTEGQVYEVKSSECFARPLGSTVGSIGIVCNDLESSYSDDIKNGKTPNWSATCFELLPDNAIVTQPEIVDMVNKPKHYTQGKIEVIEFIEDKDFSFRIANVIKYICRAKHKGTELIDLRKALWYLEREIKKVEEAKNNG